MRNRGGACWEFKRATPGEQVFRESKGEALSLSVGRSGDYASQPGLERYRHLCAAVARLHERGRRL